MSARDSRHSLEWPTVALCAGVFVAWGAITYWQASLPCCLLLPAGAALIALHASLQHEILHGHPTKWRRFNHALGCVPLSLWLPFESYRFAHLRHHRDERLTDPLDDPESFYWSPARWAALSPPLRWLVRAQSTLAGRLLLGPAWTILRFLGDEAVQLARGDARRRRIWLRHGLWCVPVLVWLIVVCGIGPGRYLLLFVYPGAALLMLRSFAEHRAAEGVPGRTAVVENATLLGPLFLFNNLHAVHHRHPAIPWYRLPSCYRVNRAAFLHDNGALVYDGYSDVARRFLFKPHDASIHPSARG